MGSIRKQWQHQQATIIIKILSNISCNYYQGAKIELFFKNTRRTV